MGNKYYTSERNVQIVISLLKANGIKRIIASPGTTNMTFVGSVQNDPYFEVYSCVDERSAAYMACGMAEESGESVVLSCTGATASRNYMSGLTEAYYRKLPIIAITSHRGDQHIGHLKDQQIDRRNRPNDIVVESVVIPLVKDDTDEKFCMIECNKAILALKKNGGGPVHINLYTSYSQIFNVKQLPTVQVVNMHHIHSEWPMLPKGRIAIYCGVHHDFTSELTQAVDHFCATNNAVVLASHISGYHGKYKINPALVMGQTNKVTNNLEPDLIIHIGEISGETYHKFNPKKVWRISEDGAPRDMFGRLSDVFQTNEDYFFRYYSKDYTNNNSYYLLWFKEHERLSGKIADLPFGNIWIAQLLSPELPHNCTIHFGILNCLRSWNFFEIPSSVKCKSNVGGYGIDGGLSTLIGASLIDSNRLFYGVFGDLAFFYDMNVLGNRHLGKNIRLLIVNNGRGTEFRNYAHPCYSYGEDADKYMAAAGHFGNKSPNLIRHYATDLGFEYQSASTKKEFLEKAKWFSSEEMGSKPLLLEVFTDSKDESDALESILNLNEEPQRSLLKTLKDGVKSSIKGIMDENQIKGVKMILKKNK